MRRVLILLMLLAAATPAHAHKLKLFATIEAGAVTGYGFFVGGGRPRGANVIFQNADGNTLHQTQTDDEGSFTWQPRQPADLTIIMNVGDGHIARTTLSRDRFPSAASEAADAGTSATAKFDSNAVKTSDTAAPAACSTKNIKKLVSQAVERQIRPLLEAHAEAEYRASLTDIVGGIGMIIGLAGVGMWGFARRRYNTTNSK